MPLTRRVQWTAGFRFSPIPDAIAPPPLTRSVGHRTQHESVRPTRHSFLGAPTSVRCFDSCGANYEVEAHTHQADLGRGGDCRGGFRGGTCVQYLRQGHSHPLLVACRIADRSGPYPIDDSDHDSLRPASQRGCVFRYRPMPRQEVRTTMPNKITGANAGGVRQLPGWRPLDARIAQFRH